MAEGAPILEALDVVRHYPVGRRRVARAVDGVSLELRRGETLALVGESGCGKSTLSRLLLRLEAPQAGAVRIGGEDITRESGAALHRRRRDIQMIFQDPYSCLDPRMNAVAIVREPLDNYRLGSPAERQARALGLLARVGLDRDMTTRFPHQLSGGQRQRLGIARALALEPKILVADEPVSALDVSVRAQVINLLMDLQRELDLSILFVSHDIGVVAHVSHRIAVMYLGKIVEVGETSNLLAAPLHPYSRALLASVPISHPRFRRPRTLLGGDVPSATNPPPGCRFHPRCPVAIGRCRVEAPVLRRAGAERTVACHLIEPGHAPSRNDAAGIGQ
jgi:oligopeptide/dipeptide ABC transporter ATP-binding protein